jgi:hypothetical protein
MQKRLFPSGTRIEQTVEARLAVGRKDLSVDPRAPLPCLHPGSHPLKFLDEVVYFGLRPGIAVIPEIEQRILVARHPVDDLRRHLLDDADQQAVADDGRNIGNRDGKARLRSPRLQEIFHPRPVPAHRRRDEDGAGYAGLCRRKVRYFHDIVAGPLFRQSGVGGDLHRVLPNHELCLA